MTQENHGKIAIFFVLTLMSLSLHIQFPIFTPYAISLGATSILVSILLSTSSFANLVGHVISGPFIDRIGKKPFIVGPLFISAFLMMAYGLTHSIHILFILRLANSFILAFLMPSCFALLSAYAKTSRDQGKNMAINGILVTFANIVSPLIGGHLVEIIGYQSTYYIIGSLLFLTGIIAILFITEREMIVSVKNETQGIKNLLLNSSLVPVYLIAFALMYGQGTLVYEIPLLVVEKGLRESMVGMLFSFMGLGTFAISLFLIVHRFSALIRTIIGMLFISLCFYQIALPIFSLSMSWTLFGVGIGFGLLFPALTTLLTERVERSQHGTAFGLLSAVFSLGIMVSPLVSGLFRTKISPYFITFLVMVSAVILMGYKELRFRQLQSDQ